MRKSIKVWLIVATCLIISGLVLFAGIMFSVGWDFLKLSTTKFLTMSYEIDEDFSDISINADTADVKFELSQDGKCKVVCFEDVKESFEVKVEQNTLIINKETQKAWYEYIGINFYSPKITVYLPKADFSSVYIKESTGDISFSNLSVKNIDISLSTGDIFLNDIKCENLITNGSTGEVELKKVIASDKFNIKRSTGNIELTHCDAAEIFIETDTGDVEGTLLSPKVFITKTSTGKIRVPETFDGGRCEITTSTGDIEIEVSNGI